MKFESSEDANKLSFKAKIKEFKKVEEKEKKQISKDLKNHCETVINSTLRLMRDSGAITQKEVVEINKIIFR